MAKNDKNIMVAFAALVAVLLLFGAMVVLSNQANERVALTVISGEGGYTIPSGTSYHNSGDVVTVSIGTNYGYDVSSVYVDGVNYGAVEKIIVTMDQSHKVNVKFKNVGGTTTPESLDSGKAVLSANGSNTFSGTPAEEKTSDPGYVNPSPAKVEVTFSPELMTELTKNGTTQTLEVTMLPVPAGSSDTARVRLTLNGQDADFNGKEVHVKLTLQGSYTGVLYISGEDETQPSNVNCTPNGNTTTITFTTTHFSVYKAYKDKVFIGEGEEDILRIAQKVGVKTTVLGQIFITKDLTLNADLEVKCDGEKTGGFVVENIVNPTYYRTAPVDRAFVLITNGNGITIDLNGHSIISDSDGPALTNIGKLIINDSSNEKSGTIYSTDTDEQFRRAVENYGSITINNGTFGNDANRGNGFRNYGTAEVNNGSFSSIKKDSDGTAFAYAIGNGDSYYPNATMIVNNANVSGTMNGCFGVDSGVVTINGGSYLLDNCRYYMIYCGGTAKAIVHGGIFERNSTGNYFYEDMPELIEIYGGIFKNKTEYSTADPTNYLASGYYTLKTTESEKDIFDVYKAPVWDGSTKENPVEISSGVYNIYTPTQLAGLAEKVNSGEYGTIKVNLLCDLDLGNHEWTPIGNDPNKFKGTFDGKGFTISNLKIENTKDYAGLFGFIFGVDTDVTINNIIVNNVNIKGERHIGTIVGKFDAEAGFYTHIENCHVNGTVQIEGNWHVGGIVGLIKGTVSNCSVNASGDSFVKGIYLKENYEGDNIGGAIGNLGANNGKASNVLVSGIDVEGSRKVGGIVGVTNYNATIESCNYSDGTIKITASESYISSKMLAVGGIVGEFRLNEDNYKVTIKNCEVNNTKIYYYDGEPTGKIYGVITLKGVTPLSDVAGKITEENCTYSSVTLVKQ